MRAAIERMWWVIERLRAAIERIAGGIERLWLAIERISYVIDWLVIYRGNIVSLSGCGG
ncbi:hypothetical protein [Sporosarcina sp. P3]|uniref:hypothetical protein n=1 Tax=Sporosarcina sp. P3 TaxID=2048245 RepID=UPI0013045DD2|nr:hypothetical protein [Sporosarcina sp. P3]